MSRWGPATWRAEEQRWAFETLDSMGVNHANSMHDLSIQAWSAVWRISAASGDAVMKQLRPRDAQEIRFHQFCAEAAPRFVEPPLASDLAEARMLLRDGGPNLHEFDVNPDLMAEVVVDYAKLQQSLVGRDTEAAAAGIPNWSPADAVAELRSQAQILAAMPATDLRRITTDQYDRLISELPSYRSAGQVLTASAVPLSLDHGDLWMGNILAAKSSGAYRFIDLGDAAWTHPFMSLMPLLYDCHRRWTRDSTRFDLNREDLRSISSAYLGAWSQYGARQDLELAFDAAAFLAPLRRSRAVISNFEHAGVSDAHDLGPTPWTWLTAGQAFGCGMLS